MAHTLNAVCFDDAGNIAMIVIPSDDAQLDDPSFNPTGLTQLRISAAPADIAQAAPELSTGAVGALSAQAGDGVGAPNPGDATNYVIAAAAAMGVTIQLPPPVLAKEDAQTATAEVSAAALPEG